MTAQEYNEKVDDLKNRCRTICNEIQLMFGAFRTPDSIEDCASAALQMRHLCERIQPIAEELADVNAEFARSNAEAYKATGFLADDDIDKGLADFGIDRTKQPRSKEKRDIFGHYESGGDLFSNGRNAGNNNPFDSPF